MDAISLPTDWSRYLLGACSSGDPLRDAVVRNHAQVKFLRERAARAFNRESLRNDLLDEQERELHRLLDELDRLRVEVARLDTRCTSLFDAYVNATGYEPDGVI